MMDATTVDLVFEVLRARGLKTLDLTGGAPFGSTSIRAANHCYGCTASQGSSCGGALEAQTSTEPAGAA